MLQDGIQLIDGSTAENFQVQRGANLPTAGLNIGELFYKTGASAGLNVYDGSAWVAIGSGGAGTSDANALTGTTLASNVVSSSLTSVGTITSGTWSGSFGAVSGANLTSLNAAALTTGSFGAVSGANLTSLNASSLSTGTVGTARLGSGTANSTTYLRGDNTWGTVAAGGSVAGATTQIQYNNAGAFGASSKFTWTNASSTLVIGDGIDSASIRTGAVTSASAAPVFAIWGTSNNGAGASGDLTLYGGYSSTGFGGGVNIEGGAGFGSGSGGAISIQSGQSSSGTLTSGVIVIRSGTATASTSGAVTIQSGVTNTGTGGIVTVAGGDSSSGNNGTGGLVIVRGGNSSATGTTGLGGHLELRGGLGGPSGAGGYIMFSTGPTTSQVERLRILNNGAWSVGSGGAAYGTSGQVLTSNGNAAPTWAAVTVGTLANNTYIGDGTGGVSLRATDSAAGTLFLLKAGSTTSAGSGQSISLQAGTPTDGNGGAAQLQGTSGVGTNRAGGPSNITGGTGQGTAAGGNVSLTAGSSAGSGLGGNVTLTAGTSVSGAGGAIVMTTTSTERVRVAANGSVTLNSGWSDKKNAPSFSATPTIDCSLGNSYVVTMTANITAITFSNVPAAGNVFSLTMFLTQDGTGSRLVTWPASVKFAGGTAPTLTTTAAKTDIIALVTHDGGTTWFGFTGGLNF